MKDKFKQFIDNFEREHIGASFDNGYDKVKGSIKKFIERLEPEET